MASRYAFTTTGSRCDSDFPIFLAFKIWSDLARCIAQSACSKILKSVFSEGSSPLLIGSDGSTGWTGTIDEVSFHFLLFGGDLIQLRLQPLG